MNPFTTILALILVNLALGGGVAFLLGALAYRRDQADNLRSRLAHTEQVARAFQRQLIAAHAELELGRAVDRAVAGTCEDLP